MRAWDLAKRYAVSNAVRQAAALLGRTDRINVIRFLRIVERLAPTSRHREQIAWLRAAFERDHPGVRLAMRILREMHPRVRAKMIHNMMINCSWVGSRRRSDLELSEGLHVPYSILISPTMRCQLNCPGCYAATYSRDDDLEFDLWDSILEQAKELGIFFCAITGGEPLLRADELFELAWKHTDMVFLVYTNGLLIDEKMVRRLQRTGNVAMALSVEGFATETDARRGPGVHARVIEAMRLLREGGIPFGFSVCVTRENAEVVCSEAFIDYYIEQGCYFGWLFHYMPIGRDPDVHLMATPEQRDMLRRFAIEARRTKPILALDFWNDGAMLGGCLSGGHRYVHINHRGDVEPCVFAHFATHNLHECTLREALDSDFFRAIRDRQPYCENPLRSCMIVDNPQVLRDVVAQAGAKPTDPGAELLITDKAVALDEYARKWAEIADRAWQEEDYEWARSELLSDEPVPPEPACEGADGSGNQALSGDKSAAAGQ